MIALKIDLEKAYDRIDLHFLRDTLIDIGFDLPFVKIIMEGVTSCSIKVLWNG